MKVLYRSRHGLHSFSRPGQKPAQFSQHADGHGELVTEDEEVQRFVEGTLPFKHGTIVRVTPVGPDAQTGLWQKMGEGLRRRYRSL